MAQVRTFRINPKFGVPDKEIREWLNQIEREEDAALSVEATFIPAMGESDPRITLVATKVDVGFDKPPDKEES